MSADFPDEKPALGEIKIGDEVFVIAGGYGPVIGSRPRSGLRPRAVSPSWQGC